MRAKKLSWKKIISVLFFIAAIITVSTNIGFVWNCLKYAWSIIGEIFKHLANPIVRDAIMFLLICILFWFRRNKKIRSISQAERIQRMEDWQYDWNSKHEFVLNKIAEGTKSCNLLCKLYEKAFSDTSKLEFKVIMEDLEEVGLIRRSLHLFKKKYYEATRKGRELALKGLLVEMESRRIASEF